MPVRYAYGNSCQLSPSDVPNLMFGRRCYPCPQNPNENMAVVDKQKKSVQPVELQDMVDKGGSIYQAIAITARRARQINDEIKQEYQQRISTLVPVDVDEDDEMEATNFDQMKISLEIDKLGKPTLEALDEFNGSALEWRYRERE